MSLRQPASGRRVGAGMLRVDAARAIAKLRDYQLSEPTAWVLEGIRAAVASGASRIDLQGDSNDIWLSWEGEAWPAESLPSLLDELVSPASARQGQKLRLLGTAVNSALGLRPAYIDVYRISDGKAQRARYVDSILKEQESDTEVLVRPALEEVPVPERAGAAAMFIHFRRRFGMDPIRNLFQGQPPEMPIARAACGDLPIPIVIADEEFGAHRNQSDLLRVEIGHDIDGFLALVNPWYAHPSKQALMHVSEQGVRIASYTILDVVPADQRALLPVRFFINAERMPTNASRSEVRRTSHPINTAERQIPQLFKTLCEQLIKELDPAAKTEPARHALLREAALTLLAASVGGRGWSNRARHLSEPLKGLAKLKLLHNAVGEARAVADFWDEETVHTGTEALAADLRPWVARTLWLAPGDAARVIAPTEIDASVLRVLLRSARRELKARRRFESHAKREARLDRAPEHWVRASMAAMPSKSCTAPLVAVGSEALLALDGQICLLTRGRGAVTTILIDGREIEEVELKTPLPFRAVVEDRRLIPASDYRSVVRDESFEAMEEDLLSGAIRCVEAMCLDEGADFTLVEAASSEEMRNLVQSALEVAWKLVLEIGKSPLSDYAAWELVGGGAASLSDLRKYKAVGTVATGDERFAPSGRVTVVCDSLRRQQLLISLLEPDTRVVLYQPRLRSVSGSTGLGLARSLASMVSNVAAVGVSDHDCHGAIAWGTHGNDLHIYHRGVRLWTTTSTISAALAVDSDHVIPSKNWRGVHDAAGLVERDYSSWITTLVRAFAMALIGRAPKEFVYSGRGLSLHEGPGRNFVVTLMHCKNPAELLGETYEALRAAPLFEVLGGDMVSADDLAEEFPTAIDYLESLPLQAEEDESWRPLIASEGVALLVGRLLDKPVQEASSQLERRRVERLRRAKLVTHRRQNKVQQEDLIADSPRVIEFKSEFAHGLVGIGAGTSPSYIDVHVLVEERPFIRSQTRSLLPIAAAIEIDGSKIEPDFDSVAVGFALELNRALVACAPSLLEAHLQETSTAMVSDWLIRRFCGLWLQGEEIEPSAVDRIRALACFYDQRGEILPLRDACTGAFLDISTYAASPWLEATEGSAQDKLDAPVLTMSEDNAVGLTPILHALCGDVVVRDLSESMRALQIARRIEQGLLRAPTVPVEPSLKRSLTDLIGSEVVGEVGFHEGPGSQVRVCEQGEERVREELDLIPAVVVALEDPTLIAAAERDQMWAEKERLENRVSDMTLALLASVLASKVELPEWLRQQIVLALCMGSIGVEEVTGLATRELFYTTAGVRVCWDDLLEQASRFGDVWQVLEGDKREPLEPLRIAVALPLQTRKVFTGALPFVDASDELSMDELARQNQARPPVASLALSEEQSRAAITSMELDDDDIRGVVAPLFPDQAGWRGVVAHRQMQRIGSGKDPCTWPTIAIVDDALLSPDRTWSDVVDDAAWEAVCEAIVKASDHALVKAMPPPMDMLTSHWVGRSVESREPEYRKKRICVRGRLWLTGSTDPGTIKIRQSSGEVLIHPGKLILRGMRFPLPVHGELIVHPAQDLRLDIAFGAAGKLVDEIVEIVYPRLLRQVGGLKRGGEDAKAAHLAMGIAMDYVKPKTAKKSSKKSRFVCFAPDPLTAAELAVLTQGSDPVAMIDKDQMTVVPETLVFVRDGSELSRAVERILAGRTFNTASSTEAVSVEALVPDPVQPTLKARSTHVLERLASDLHGRLSQLSLHTEFDSVSIAPQRRTPILSFERGRLMLAGQNSHLLALQATQSAGDFTYEGALDLMAAHATTLLNHGLTSVTDAAEQRALVSLMRLR